ncbi:MAG TPA: hypothetical protein OIM42_05235 [Clostridiaceae bacterium]|jgi:hypothetical protein|nr:hypothetical protein [Clostridiaceae bacterium]
MKNMLFQAKQIRKMAYEGKTKNEIMSELGLSEAQFQYRLKKVYSESAVKSLRKKLKTNQKRANGVTVVLDSSAMEDKDIVQYLFSKGIGKVILADQILEELDRHKTEKSTFGKNIRETLRLVACDKASEKFKVVFLKKATKKVDHNLLYFCKARRDEVLLCTGDYEQACLAKGMKIPYRLNGEQFEPCAKKDCNEQEMEAKTVEEQEDTKSTSNLFKIADITISGSEMLLKVPQVYQQRYGYIVIRGGNIQEPVSNVVRVKLGDDIILMRYNKQNNVLDVSQYRITKCDVSGQGLFIKKKKITNPSVGKIRKVFPECNAEVAKKMRNLLFFIRN